VNGPQKAHFEFIRDMLLGIDFKAVYVLIDKVDETAETGNSAEASFNVVKPLIRDLELLQIKKTAFKFFLWDMLLPRYKAHARPDRLEQFELVWTEADLTKMLSRRLEAFSGDKVHELSQLTNGALAKPRDMIRICQEILSEQLQLNPESAKIEVHAILQGIAKFSTKRAQELLSPQVYKELVKVGRLDFTASYVANEVFKFDVNSARNKIRQWTEAGAVQKVGELGSGGRPIFQYTVRDIRVGKAITSQLSLTEFMRGKLRNCTRCKATVIRDWDLGSVQTCQSCGFEIREDVDSAH
jgi:hypothetical protein